MASGELPHEALNSRRVFELHAHLSTGVRRTGRGASPELLLRSCSEIDGSEFARLITALRFDHAASPTAFFTPPPRSIYSSRRVPAFSSLSVAEKLVKALPS